MSAPLSLTDALDRLRDPGSWETWSPFGSERILVVDVASSAEDLAPAARLAELPCPTVAWRAGEASPAGARLLDAFDVHADDEAQLGPVVDAAKRSPLAASVLVQLLRHSETLPLHDALLAESWAYSTLQSGPEFATWLAARTPGDPAPEHPEPAVLARREGPFLHLTLNRPERHNAYSAEMRDALCELLDVADADPSIERIRLDGAGSSFSSGGELVEFGTLADPATAHAVRSVRNAGRLLARLAPRVEVHVHGACVGAGVELPAFAAKVCARADAWFMLPELSMGLVPGAGGTASLPRRIGRRRTAWLALSGERIDARTALEWGLVDEIR
ncbi:MAG: enoyl-CoA hydratase/isomerase family protein [Deltaproteobacteria bacterium]|nr:enoyl-CoA hydratase/isomerase family protein [Deltaproteobacteria bacterium]